MLVGESGDVIELEERSGGGAGKVRVGRVFIGGTLEEVDEIVVRDRRHISEGGIVLAVVAINSQTGDLQGEPEIVSRGFVFEEARGDLLREASAVLRRALPAAPPQERSRRRRIKALI